MTSLSVAHGVLFVEGKDDCHALLHLLARNGVVLDENKGPVLLKHKGSDSEVIATITTAVKSSGSHAVGFVMDSDDTVQKRWGQIRAKLMAVDLLPTTPSIEWSDELPEDGFVTRSIRYERKVGVWIMPNNRTDYGKIEDLLTTLVPESDKLYEIAKEATTKALEESGLRPANRKAIQKRDERKGQLHSWLAWQEEPGMSYGHALRRKYFEQNSEVALAFVNWFKRLYELD